MKIGVLGDVHANLAALQATLAALDAEGCDQLLCTGDLVGYGPSPAECVKIIREREIPCVLGNHDKYVTLIADPQLDRLEPEILTTVQWTQSRLDMQALKWLAELPLRLDADTFSVIHGIFGPHRWAYIVRDPKYRDEHFANQDTPLVFCGHCHMPLLGVQQEGRPVKLDFLKTSTLPTGAKAMVNPGSVGQPRDRDPRAACVVYEMDDQIVRPLRVEYDIAATQALMRAAKLPERHAARLADGK